MGASDARSNRLRNAMTNEVKLAQTLAGPMPLTGPLVAISMLRGTPDRTRTCGLLLRRQALYPLSYGCVIPSIRNHPGTVS